MCIGFVLYSIANSKTSTSIPEINTHPQSESTLINRSIHPNSLTHSHFTFVQSPHSQSSIFCSFRERKIQSFFPNNTRYQTKENGKQSDPIEIVLWNKPNQAPINHSTIISKHFLYFVISSQVFCVFGLRKTSKSCFHSTKIGSPIYHTMRNSLDLRIDCGIILLMIDTSVVVNRTGRSDRRGQL